MYGFKVNNEVTVEDAIIDVKKYFVTGVFLKPIHAVLDTAHLRMNIPEGVPVNMAGKSWSRRSESLDLQVTERNGDHTPKSKNVVCPPSFLVGCSTAMLSKRWARVLYISTYIATIVGIGLALLVTGYDLIEQTLALAQGGGRYFYIFILVGAYVATVLSPLKATD